MEEEKLYVRMLGTFSLALGQQEIQDSDNRSRKVWLLLAYMIYCRNRSVTQQELVNLIWGEEERSSNPVNALKTMFHRVRAMLNQLGESVGHDLIVRRGGNYRWNTEIPMTLDVDEFERLCQAGAANPDAAGRLEQYLAALRLYSGDFLNKLSAESWVVPISTYYHNQYLRAVQEALEGLEAAQRKEEAVRICRQALELEPYSEELYHHLMRNLLDLGDQRGAVAVYEEMSELLFSNFGVMPSEEIRLLYREAVRTVNDRAIPLGEVREQLREPDPANGAMLCDYDFFRMLYQVEARFIARSGDAIHIALISVHGEGNAELPKRSLDRVMENLRDQIRINLRRGDVAAQCSVSQYILMLPQANYENSCMVCERITKSFARQFPHSPAVLHYCVQPLEPTR